MWMTRCKVLVQNYFNHFGCKAPLPVPRRTNNSIRRNNCQQSHPSSALLCQTQVETTLANVPIKLDSLRSSNSFHYYSSIRKHWTTAHFHPLLVLRSSFSDCNKPPNREEGVKSGQVDCQKVGKSGQDDNCEKAVKGGNGDKAHLPTSTVQSVTSPRGLVYEQRMRQNFHPKCEDMINLQIKEEISAAYLYIAMASYCNLDGVALAGFSKFFTHAYKEEMDHVKTLISYLNTRGGQLRLFDVPAPPQQEWTQAHDLLKDALTLEVSLYQSLLELHACAATHGDPHLTDFLEGDFLRVQVDAIKALADMLTTLQRAREDLGVHLFNAELLGGNSGSHGNGT